MNVENMNRFIYVLYVGLQFSTHNSQLTNFHSKSSWRRICDNRQVVQCFEIIVYSFTCRVFRYCYVILFLRSKRRAKNNSYTNRDLHICKRDHVKTLTSVFTQMPQSENGFVTNLNRWRGLENDLLWQHVHKQSRATVERRLICFEKRRCTTTHREVTRGWVECSVLT